MLQIRVIVEGKQKFLDLYKDEPILLNVAAAEIQDITKKNSGYSKQFTLPGTKFNNEVFNFYYDLNALPTSFNPNNKFNATLLWEGYEILTGYIRLNSVSMDKGENMYNVTFYNQIGDLAANIGDKFLFDLDLSHLSHPYSEQVILESNIDPNLFSLTGTTNYSYQDGRTWWELYNIGFDYISGNTVNPLISPLVQFTPLSGQTYVPEYGNFDSQQSPVRDFYYKPSIQVRELYKTILDQAGYKMESNFFETAYAKKYYLPLKFADESVYPKNAVISCFSYVNENILFDLFPYEYYTDPTTDLICNTLAYPTDANSFTVNNEFAGVYTYRFGLVVQPTSDCYYDSDLEMNITPEINVLFRDGIAPPVTLYSATFCSNSAQQDISFDKSFSFTGDSTVSFTLSGLNVNVLFFKPEIISGPRFLVPGQNIDYSIEFPNNDYKQLDFITSMNKYFNLVVVPNPDKPNTLIVEPIVDYFGEGQVLDWTTKVDWGQPQSLAPTTSIINGTLNFDFKVDSDYANFDFRTQINRTFGTDNFQLNLEFKDNVTKFESMFSSPIDTTINCANPPLLTLTSMSKLKTVDLSGATLQTFVPFKTLPKLVFRGLTLPNDNYGFLGNVLFFSGSPNCTQNNDINVTRRGWAKYFDCEGNQTFIYLNRTGRTILPQCMDFSTLIPGFPLADIANFTRMITGSTCIQTGFTNVYQTYWMNDVQMDRISLSNRFTTYPFAYTGFSHYINWKGSDFSDVVQPREYVFDSEDLYDIYYDDYIKDLTSDENKIFTTKAYLYPYDITQLKFNEKILINNSYFRINKISNFNASEPAICDVELVKLTRDYNPHRTLYYKMTSCDTGEFLYSNSNLMYNLYGYIGNYTTIYDDDLNYLGCYAVGLDVFDPDANYQHYYLSSGYTSNLVNIFPDCGCTGRTSMTIIQEEPGIPRFYAYNAESCDPELSGVTFTLYSSNPNLLTGFTNVYKVSILFEGELSEFGCFTNFIRVPYPAYDSNYVFEHFNSCEECLFVPPTPTPTQTPTISMTPSNTPTISVTPSLTPSPTATRTPYCYTIQGIQSIPGECFNCPNTYPSVTDWYIEFFDGCGGTEILPPLDMNVIAYYSDGSTQNTFIPAGGTGQFFIASSNVQCGFPPECAEIASPTFEYADVIPVLGEGTINQCCVEPTPTPTSVTPTPTSQTPTPTPTPSVTPPVGNKSLIIYARDIASSRATITMFYNVNGTGNINIPGAIATQIPSTCSNLYTITGLNLGDVVTVGTSINCVMEGTLGLISCPSITGFNLNYTYVMDAPSTQSISLTIDTSVIP